MCFHCKRIMCLCPYYSRAFFPMKDAKNEKEKQQKTTHTFRGVFAIGYAFIFVFSSALPLFPFVGSFTICTFLQLWNWNHDLALSFAHHSWSVCVCACNDDNAAITNCTDHCCGCVFFLLQSSQKIKNICARPSAKYVSDMDDYLTTYWRVCCFFFFSLSSQLIKRRIIYTYFICTNISKNDQWNVDWSFFILFGIMKWWIWNIHDNNICVCAHAYAASLEIDSCFAIVFHLTKRGERKKNKLKWIMYHGVYLFMCTRIDPNENIWVGNLKTFAQQPNPMKISNGKAISVERLTDIHLPDDYRSRNSSIIKIFGERE